ncbi:hypothetical protein VNO77_18633 [Canavalia gladiata]|uniref:Uncharacterized protein n=1 Tax=Canavalia gladiata TaxID=3824 RepID=A0AAN9LLV8_CANGL
MVTVHFHHHYALTLILVLAEWKCVKLNVVYAIEEIFLTKVVKGHVKGHDTDCEAMYVPNPNIVLILVKERAVDVVLLDSYPSKDMLEVRKGVIKKAMFFEEMFSFSDSYQFDVTMRPLVSNYEIVVPKDLNVQDNDLNDCGVWVAIWMMKESDGDFNLQIDHGTRLKLVVDLVIHPYNTIREDIINKAHHHLEQYKAGQRM